MAKTDDPSLYESNFERNEGDRYFTHPWVTGALVETWPEIPSPVWEPSAGRGDIVRCLQDFGIEVELASDLDLSEFDFGLCDAAELDFLEGDTRTGISAQGIIMNPPYRKYKKRSMSQWFVERALEYVEAGEIEFVAALLRSEFCKATTRRHIFKDCEHYAGEVALTSRPRWDWWFREQADSGPRHNFSWFIWSKHWMILKGDPVQLFHHKGKKK